MSGRIPTTAAAARRPVLSPEKAEEARKLLGEVPLLFERNDGQYGNGFDFVAQAPGQRLLLHPWGATVQVGSNGSQSEVGMRFVGSGIGARPVPSSPGDGLTNYYIGNDRRQWRSGIQSFERLRYAGVYDGIDVEYYGRGSDLEYDFIVAPHSDPGQIGIAFDGATGLCLEADGSMVVETAGHEIRHVMPEVYQTNGDGSHRDVGGRFVMEGGTVRIAVNAYDHDRELIIDPVIAATYLVRADSYQIAGIAVDGTGAVYVAGKQTYTQPATRSEIPATSRDAQNNAWILKLNADSSIAYCTYIGGSGYKDDPAGIAVDGAGNAYVLGITESSDFPTTDGAPQRYAHMSDGMPDYDLYIVKLYPGGTLGYSTYFGSNQDDYPGGIAVDSSGNAYISDSSWSNNFPGTVFAWYGVGDTAVVKVNPAGTAFTWVSVVPAGDVRDLAIDETGAVYLTGRDIWEQLPTTPNVVQPDCTDCDDAWVAKLDPNGQLILMTYLGGSDTDAGTAIAVDSSHNVYVGGTTSSLDFRTTSDALQKDAPGFNSGFLVKLNSDFSAILYSTYIGGTSWATTVKDVAVDEYGFVSVYAQAPADAPSLDDLFYPIECTGSSSAHVFRFNASNQLQYAVCFPGDAEGGFAARADAVWAPVDIDNGCYIRKLTAGTSPQLTLRDLYPTGRSTVPGAYFRVYAEAGVIQAGSTITFGGQAGTYVVADPEWNRITGVLPNLPPGLYDVTVTTPGGATATLAHAFESISGNFAITSVSPGTVNSYSSQVLTVTGTGFPPDAISVAVQKADHSTSPYYCVTSRNSSSIVTAVFPPLAGGSYDVSVRVGSLSGGEDVVTLPGALTVAGPAIEPFNRITGHTAGGDKIWLHGPDMKQGTTATIGGQSVLPGGSDGTLEMTTPAHAAGAVDLVITSPAAGTATYPNGFKYIQDVTVTDVQPRNGPQSGGTSVTITGTGFQPGARVFFYHAEATSVTVVNSMTITAMTPARPCGTKYPVVVNPDGGWKASNVAFTYDGPCPSQINPASGPTTGGASGAPSISGIGFDSTCKVYFDGVQATTGTIYSTGIYVTSVPPHAYGPVDVKVTRGDGLSATLYKAYRYLEAAPTITSVSPSAGPVSGGTAITITGTNFSPGATVTVGGRPLINPTVTSTSITGVTPVGNDGGQYILVTNRDHQSVYVLFTYMGTPAITSLWPNTGPVGGGTSVTIGGSRFHPPLTVTFGGVAGTISASSDTQVTVSTPAHAAGDVDVKLTNSDGQFTTQTNGFRYLPGLPTITSFSPATAVVGDPVVITGTNFALVNSVEFFSSKPAIFTVNSTTQITATVPSGATTGPITITTASGTATSGSNFVVDSPLPRIDSFSPVSGAPGATVTITGARFTGASSVLFGGIAATFTVNSATQITATVPPGALSGVISVTAPAGTATSVQAFGVPPRFGATPLSPSSGPRGAAVVLNGANFEGATQVTFNGVAATFSVTSGTAISTSVPATATSGYVAVTTPYGAVTSSTRFMVVPAVTSFTPTSGGPGTSVTITGTGFVSVTGVGFGGYAASSFSVLNDTTITAVVGANGGTGTVTVTTADGTGTSAGTFTFTGPTISGFNPIKGAAGTQVTITGTNLSGATAVTFNGVAGAIVPGSNTATSISATAPPNVTNGPIGVTVGGVTALSATIFHGVPLITSFTPMSGSPGTTVTINGNNFLGAIGVGFGGNNFAAATFTVISNTRVDAVVPAFATNGSISVETPYTRTWSYGDYASFTVTPAAAPVLTANRVAGSASIHLSWSGVGWQYDISRATSATGTPAWIFRTDVNTTSFNDTPPGPGTYFYKVTRVNTTTNPASNVDWATSIAFADDPIVAGSTVVQAVHLTQLRQAVDWMRAATGLAGYPWSDVTPNGVPVRAAHINQLRTAVTQAWNQLGVTVVNFATDPGTITSGVTIKAAHFQELRNTVK